MFGEEYTLVAVADYVLSKLQGNTVSNMSSSRALRDITKNMVEPIKQVLYGRSKCGRINEENQRNHWW